jgi:hypothetical protein
MLVARLDLDLVTPEEAEKWLTATGLVLPTQATFDVNRAPQALEALKGAGAQELYAVVSPAYLAQASHAPAMIVVVPLTRQVNAAVIAEVLKRALGAAEQVSGTVCAGPKRNLERLRTMTPTPQPLLEQAFARAGDGALQVAVSLTADQRRAIEETLPELPAGLGGGPSKVLTRGVMWVAASFDLTPRPVARAVAQCRDQQAAQEAGALVGRILENVGESEYVRQAVPNYRQLVPTLTPRVVGDTLALSLQAPDLEAGLKAWRTALAEPARLSESLAHLHGIMLGCTMYANDHKGEYPDELKQVPDGRYLDSKAELQNPMRPDLEIGYVYRKPAKNAPGGTVVVYEQYERWPAWGVAVGFLDWAVQRVYDQELFKKMLEKGR